MSVGGAVLTVTVLLQVAAQPARPPLRRADLERWADSMVATYVRESARPSLAIVVVQEDRVVLAKGYGLEREDGTPVSADSSVFHIASISKLFVVSAVLQLVDARRLRLDDPVRAYLPRFEIPEAITVRHLLTHTSGVDSPFLADVVESVADLQPLSAYFASHPPRFGRPAMAEIRYSNYGMTLAALVVERVSGEQFDAYVERHLFGPLGMTSSSIRQPPAPGIEARMATAGTGRVPNYLLTYPAGAGVSTPADMGRFLRFLLRGAGDRGTRLLSARALAELRRRQWSPHDAVPGVALGLLESDMGGARALFHTGARVHFSLVYLLPDANVGLFVVHAMRQGGRFQALRTDIARAFVERYFRTAVDTPPARTRPPEAYAGVYRPVLFSTTTIERAARMISDTRVLANADGTLDVRLPVSAPLHVVRSAPAVFRVLEGDNAGLAIAFDDTVRPRRMFLSGATQDPVAFNRLRWFERGVVSLVALAIAFAVMASYVPLLLGAALVRMARAMPRDRSTAHGGLATWPAIAGSLLLIATPLVGIALAVTSSDATGPGGAVTAAASLLFAGSALSLATIPITVVAIRRHYWSRRRRLYHALYASASAVLFVLVVYHHLGPFWT